MPDPSQTYGVGFAFPVLPAGNRHAFRSESRREVERDPRAVRPGGLRWVAGTAAVYQALRTLLLTQPGERLGRPDYGCGLRRFLFQPNTVTTRTLIRQTVEKAIVRFEPRVEIDRVSVRADAADDTVIIIDIRFRLVDQPGTEALVFPFYLDGRAA